VNARHPFRAPLTSLALASAVSRACGGGAPAERAGPARSDSLEPAASWTRFGGPSGDFRVQDHGLAAAWPHGGPRRLWSRALGPGYSGIVASGDRLFTMYRDGREEVIVGLDAQDGRTLWEHRYVSLPVPGHDHEYGDGPNATPLLADGRLYAIGVAGMMHCLEATSGEVLWSHDLWGELGGTVLELGYSSSPIPYRDTVIALVGGENRGAVAFRASSGSVEWTGPSFRNSYSTPMIANLRGREQLIAFAATEVVGADPTDGSLLWRHPIRNRYPQNICQPIRVDEDLLFVSTLEAGSRGLRLAASDPPRVEVLWSTTRLQCFYSSMVLQGEIIYGVSGYQASPRMTALNARSGRVVWRQRGFAVAHVLAAGDRLLILDEDGRLALATPAPDGLTIDAEAPVLTAPARTAPTVVGTTLYARDLRSLVALDLGR